MFLFLCVYVFLEFVRTIMAKFGQLTFVLCCILGFMLLFYE